MLKNVAISRPILLHFALCTDVNTLVPNDEFSPW